jgi:hypothetical protein
MHGWGGADMLNLFDPSGRKLVDVAQKRRPIAPRSQKSARAMGASKVIPFSSFQCYQREDSVWAKDLVPELADYPCRGDAQLAGNITRLLSASIARPMR